MLQRCPPGGEDGADPLSRTHINALNCAAVIALPGSAGTLSEVALATRYGRPLAAYLPAGRAFQGLPADVRRVADLTELDRLLRESLG